MIDAARTVLVTTADEAVTEEADRMVRDEGAEWVLDPHIDNVVGLVDQTGRVQVIVYVEHEDFECSADFEQRLNA